MSESFLNGFEPILLTQEASALATAPPELSKSNFLSSTSSQSIDWFAAVQKSDLLSVLFMSTQLLQLKSCSICCMYCKRDLLLYLSPSTILASTVLIRVSCQLRSTLPDLPVIICQSLFARFCLFVNFHFPFCLLSFFSAGGPYDHNIVVRQLYLPYFQPKMMMLLPFNACHIQRIPCSFISFLFPRVKYNFNDTMDLFYVLYATFSPHITHFPLLANVLYNFILWHTVSVNKQHSCCYLKF